MNPSMEGQSEQLTVLVVGDGGLARSSLCLLVRSLTCVQKAVEVTTSEAIRTVREQSFDVVVWDMDHSVVHCASFLKKLQDTVPEVRIVGVTHQEEPDAIRAAYENGVIAVVLKNQTPQTLKAAIRTAAGGDVWLNRPMINSFLSPPRQNDGVEVRWSMNGSVARLTRREQQIIRAVGKGYRNKTIAAELCLSEATVRHHLSSIFCKLNLSDRLELLLFAQRNGLIDTADRGT